MVLYDASKLTALRAAVKVLVSSATNKGSAQTAPAAVEAAIITLRRRTRDTAPWLWINLPNTLERCRYVMFGEQKGTVHSELA